MFLGAAVGVLGEASSEARPGRGPAGGQRRCDGLDVAVVIGQLKRDVLVLMAVAEDHALVLKERGGGAEQGSIRDADAFGGSTPARAYGASPPSTHQTRVLHPPPPSTNPLALEQPSDGVVVSLAELKTVQWPEDADPHKRADSSVANIVWELRPALGDEDQCLLQTVRDEGYRLVPRPKL